MSEKQLRLIAAPRPLSERFGRDFFRAIPREPGVYLMFGSGGRILYVGQSRNLRQRLNSYRYLNPERNSRKLIRLIHSVERIEWQPCADESSAKLRENHLLREHRPRFNSLNTWPKAHCFIGLTNENQSLDFCFTRQVPAQPENFYGAFKSSALNGYRSLIRLLWTVTSQTKCVHDLPRELLMEKVPATFRMRVDSTSIAALHPLLSAFLRGESNEIIGWIQNHLPAVESLTVFHQKLISADLEQLELFYRLGPVRNAALRRKHGVHSMLIGQEALDDLLAVERSSRC